MLPPRHRLRTSADFAAVLQGARRAGGSRSGSRLVVVHANSTDARAGQPPRVGFVVSKAVGNAVVRNRTKRVLRHVMAARIDQGARGHRPRGPCQPAGGRCRLPRSLCRRRPVDDDRAEPAPPAGGPAMTRRPSLRTLLALPAIWLIRALPAGALPDDAAELPVLPLLLRLRHHRDRAVRAARRAAGSPAGGSCAATRGTPGAWTTFRRRDLRVGCGRRSRRHTPTRPEPAPSALPAAGAPPGE